MGSETDRRLWTHTVNGTALRPLGFSAPQRTAASLVLVLCALLALATSRPAHGDPRGEPPPCTELDTAIDAIHAERSHDPTQATTRYEGILYEAEAASCALVAARAVNGLGLVALAETRLVDALEQFENASRRLASVQTETLEVDGAFETALLYNLATTALRLGWLDQASDALERLVAAERRIGTDATERASTLLEISRVRRLTGRVDAARAAIDEALALDASADAPTPVRRIALLEEAAWVAAEQNRPDDAEALLRDALATIEPAPEPQIADRPAEAPPHAALRADLHADLAELLLRQGAGHAEDGHPEDGHLENGHDHLDAALGHLDHAAALLRAGVHQHLDLEAHIQHLRSRALGLVGDLDAARHAADAGLLLLDATRDAWGELALPFLARRRAVIAHRLHLAARADDPHDAWRVIERHRARALVATLADRDRSRDGRPAQEQSVDDLRAHLLDAVHALDTLDFDDTLGRELAAKRLRRLRLELDRRQTRRLASVPAADTPDEVIPPERALALAGGPVLVVARGETSDGRTSWHLLALSADDDSATGAQYTLRLVSLPSARLVAAMEAARRTLEATHQGPLVDPPPLWHTRPWTTLGELILGPVADLLTNGDGDEESERLVVLADDPVAALPFALLPHPRTSRPLVESHAVVHLPSFAALDALHRHRTTCPRPPHDLLALGDPLFSARDPRWPADRPERRGAEESLQYVRLAASADEARAVAASADDATLLLGADATRPALLEAVPSHRILHLATHARTDPAVPQRSKLVLGCTGEGDGPCDLYLPEIAALRLCAPLVVLSACATAVGTPVESEGTLGLPRAFLRAGTATVVASHWSVDDEPTALLMTSFHRHLRRGHDVAAALQQAQLERLRVGAPPRDWAAFVVIGDPQPPSGSATIRRESVLPSPKHYD